MSTFRARFLIAFFLVAFMVAKGGFWFALNARAENRPMGPGAHACACTGAPVCQCRPSGCCGQEVTVSYSDNATAIHSPTLCGKLGQGTGSVGETVMVPLALEPCRINPAPVSFFLTDLGTSISNPIFGPDFPPPKG